ncbi:MAG: glutamate/aspartate:proton symporter GltP [Bacteroidetes bacterium]|nr:MAG: glutamate/aspartate:proton symporter GltP [Bacteroidota bacterium]
MNQTAPNQNNQAHKKSTAKKILTHFSFWVLVAVVLGIVVGHFFPEFAIKTEFLAKYFIKIITFFIGPIIFLTIVLGISGMGNLGKVGRIGIKALVYFEIVTTIALIIGILVADILQPGKISKSGLAHGTNNFTPSSGGIDWKSFFLHNFTLQVLAVAIIVGIILNLSSKKDKVISILKDISDLVFKGLKVVMYIAPLGAFGGMASTVGKYGLETLLPLGKLLTSVYCTMAIFIFGVLGLIMRYYGFSIWKYLKLIREEFLIVLGTSSSEAALPSLINKLGLMGCSKPVVGLVVPAGYSFNMDGTSIYLSMSVVFLAQLYNTPLSFAEEVTMIAILMLTSKGAAGVTGSGFVVLASTITALHKIPLEGLSFLLAVDKFMSEARAITNMIGNGVATIVIAKTEKEFIPNKDYNIERSHAKALRHAKAQL